METRLPRIVTGVRTAREVKMHLPSGFTRCGLPECLFDGDGNGNGGTPERDSELVADIKAQILGEKPLTGILEEGQVLQMPTPVLSAA